MKKGLILFVFPLLLNCLPVHPKLNDSLRQGWKPYFGLSLVKSWHKTAPLVWHYHSFVGPFAGINPEEFDKNKDNMSFLKYAAPISFKTGIINHIINNGFVNLEISFTQITKTEDENRLIFTDQIDPNKGFVNPSRVNVQNVNYCYRVLSFGFMYLIEQNISSRFDHRLGFKIQSDVLLNSVYAVQGTINGEQLYFYDKDLTLNDKVFNIYPIFHYEASLVQ